MARYLSNLPAEVTSFVGRRQELREVKRLLTTTRLLTLTGSGGAGKTKLALRAAAEMARGFPDGAINSGRQSRHGLTAKCAPQAVSCRTVRTACLRSGHRHRALGSIGAPKSTASS